MILIGFSIVAPELLTGGVSVVRSLTSRILFKIFPAGLSSRSKVWISEFLLAFCHMNLLTR